MRATTLLRSRISVQDLFARDSCAEPRGLVVDVVPARGKARCSECGAVAAGIKDRRERRWRAPDLGGLRLHLRYRLARVHCPKCMAVKTQAVSWAAPGSHFTHDFEERFAYLAQQSSQTAVGRLMRTTWRTVGHLVTRYVGRRLDGGPDRLENLVNIGVDELSYRKHHKYLTVVVNHDTGDLVWAAEGKNAATLSRFFEELGEERCALVKSITMDMSAAYIKAAKQHLPNAKQIYDRFHVQGLVHDASDAPRRDEMRGMPKDVRKELKGLRWAVQKSPGNLDSNEVTTLEQLEVLNAAIYRGYLLKESFTAILAGRQINVARARFIQWIEGAKTSGLAHFARATKTIEEHLEGILEYIRTRRNNGRVEGINGKIRTITRRAYGFYSARALIAMLLLCCGGVKVTPAFRSPLLTH